MSCRPLYSPSGRLYDCHVLLLSCHDATIQALNRHKLKTTAEIKDRRVAFHEVSCSDSVIPLETEHCCSLSDRFPWLLSGCLPVIYFFHSLFAHVPCLLVTVQQAFKRFVSQVTNIVTVEEDLCRSLFCLDEERDDIVFNPESQRYCRTHLTAVVLCSHSHKKCQRGAGQRSGW